MRKKFNLLTVIFTIILILSFCFGCTTKSKSISYIQKTGTSGNVDFYTVYYTDGTTFTYEITNGTSGQESSEFSLSELYQEYLQYYPNATYQEFLQSVFSVEQLDNSNSIQKSLLSSAKVYCEFTETYRVNPIQTATDTAIYLGSAVIYKIDQDYTYFITNYHVVYDSASNEKTPKKITCYLYGSEDEPVETQQTDANGCTVYDYGNYGIDCEYVGGAISTDIAVFKAPTDRVKQINPSIKAVEFAQGYSVGQTAIAIGNPEGEGISVTEGVVSIDNETISLAIDGTTRNYRSIRIDTAIYNGSSGGGLFDGQGKLIGITNAGDGEDQNVNYAVPLEVVKYSVENILYYYHHYGENVGKKITLGISVVTENSKYVYDEQLGYGRIEEDVILYSVSEGICSQLGLMQNDKLNSIFINSVEYKIDRSFKIADVLLQIRSGDKIKFSYQRETQSYLTQDYTVFSSDLNQSL